VNLSLSLDPPRFPCRSGCRPRTPLRASLARPASLVGCAFATVVVGCWLRLMSTWFPDWAEAARRPIIGGNWKCNPTSPAELPALVANINACDTSGCDVFVCPSPLHVGLVYQSFTNGAKVAPQNCNFKGCGAFTGEMAAEQVHKILVCRLCVWRARALVRVFGEPGGAIPRDPPPSTILADARTSHRWWPWASSGC